MIAMANLYQRSVRLKLFLMGPRVLVEAVQVRQTTSTDIGIGTNAVANLHAVLVTAD